MADPPAASDPWWPAISERYTLLLHDYLGQLSEPLDERSIQRARALAELYRSPWVAEHFQCLHTEDGSYNLNYVFPPLYTEEFLERFVRNACALKARLDQPLVMENIPGFFDVKASQMPEPAWLRRFFEATRTGFLLDLPHVWLQAHYRKVKPERWLAEFPRGHAHPHSLRATDHERQGHRRDGCAGADDGGPGAGFLRLGPALCPGEGADCGLQRRWPVRSARPAGAAVRLPRSALRSLGRDFRCARHARVRQAGRAHRVRARVQRQDVRRRRWQEARAGWRRGRGRPRRRARGGARRLLTHTPGTSGAHHRGRDRRHPAHRSPRAPDSGPVRSRDGPSRADRDAGAA